MNPLPPVVYHSLDTSDFKAASCPDLALALFMNKSIEAIAEGIQSCCSPQSIFSRTLSACFGSAPSLRDSCPELNQTLTDYQISPLHLAAMSQNLDAVSLLASRGAHLDATDVHGFTPFHHMALQGNLAGLKLLDSLGANTELRTHDGGSAEDFLRYTAPFRDPAEWKLRKDAIRAHHEIDPVCLKTTIALVDSPVAPPQVLADYVWNFRDASAGDELNPLFNQHLMESHRAFVQAPPRLEIKQNDAISSCGLFAYDPIPKGAVIGYYGGEFFSMSFGQNVYGKNPESTEYKMLGTMPIYGDKYRSPVAMASDGFPNSVFIELRDTDRGVRGLPYQPVLIATQDIQPGQEILVDYGKRHNIKKGGHIELEKEEIIRYFSKSTINSLLKSIRSATSLKTADQAFTVIDFISKFTYAYRSPVALKLVQTETGLKNRDLERLDEAFDYARSIANL